MQDPHRGAYSNIYGNLQHIISEGRKTSIMRIWFPRIDRTDGPSLGYEGVGGHIISFLKDYAIFVKA